VRISLALLIGCLGVGTSAWNYSHSGRDYHCHHPVAAGQLVKMLPEHLLLSYILGPSIPIRWPSHNLVNICSFKRALKSLDAKHPLQALSFYSIKPPSPVFRINV